MFLFVGISTSDSAISDGANSSSLNTFLDDGGTHVLSAKSDGKRIAFTNKVKYTIAS